MDIKSRVIMVTGAGGGLGRAIATQLAQQAACLVLVDIDDQALAQTRAACQQAGAERVAAYTVDLTNEAAVERLFDDIIRDFGRLDGLINNAGVIRDALLVKAKEGRVISKMSSQDWDTVININLRGVFLCAREAAARMIEHNPSIQDTPEASRGVIINISSISRAGNPGQGNYAAAKAGIAALTSTWAQELARHQIRVTAIAPGFCDTAMVAGMPEHARDKLTSRIPAQRLGKPEEIAQTVAFVLGNDFINGRVLEIDGGMRL